MARESDYVTKRKRWRRYIATLGRMEEQIRRDGAVYRRRFPQMRGRMDSIDLLFTSLQQTLKYLIEDIT